MKGNLKWVLLSLWLCAMRISARETGGVSGVVKEQSTGLPMEYASVALYQSSDRKPVDGCNTDSMGRFIFTGIPKGEYYIVGSYIGSAQVSTPAFKVTDSVTTDIGTLFLSDSQMLSEIVVEGHKSTFVAGLDKKIFNVDRNIVSPGGSASDLLQSIPSVDVDLDGVVSLRGNANVTILINGKPSAMMGERTRGDALAQMSAGNIEKIEVIANPSAEYKPDGMSGIINIVLKKENGSGLNGTANASVGSYGRLNGGVNLNYGAGGFNFFGGYSYRRDRYDRTVADHRESMTEIINQDTYGVGQPVSHTVRLGVNRDISPHDFLEFAGSYSHRKFRRNETMESETLARDGICMDSYHRVRDALARENMWEATARYSHNYGESNEWGIDYTYSSESEDEINHYATVQPTSETKNDETVWDAHYLHSAKLFWKHKFNEKINLSAGYEMEHVKAEQNYHVYDWTGAGYMPDAGRSSDFTHILMLNSAYITAESRFGRWNILAGLRGEYADIRNRLLSTGENLAQNYFNLFPTLHVSRPVSSAGELMMSYSLRVNRPDGRDMNPFAEQINPLSLEAGNPYLKPEKVHSCELGWMLRMPDGGSLLSTVYYRYISNQITEVSRYVESGILLTTKENLQSSRNAGVELILGMPVAKWFDFNLNLNGYYSQIDATKLGFGSHKDTFSWSALLNADFRPFRRYMAQVNVRYRSSTQVPQGKRDGDFRVNVGMKYDIPGIDLSIMASVTDLFDTYRKSFTLDTPELKQKVEKRRNPRIFYIGAAWKFGGTGKKENTKLEYDEGL